MPEYTYARIEIQWKSHPWYRGKIYTCTEMFISRRNIDQGRTMNGVRDEDIKTIFIA